jgi:hypothetical protein
MRDSYNGSTSPSQGLSTGSIPVSRSKRNTMSKTIKIILTIILLVIAGFFVWQAVSKKETVTKEPVPLEQNTLNQNTSNNDDPVTQLKVGQALGKFTVIKIEPLRTNEKIWFDNAKISLLGQTDISGRYKYNDSTAPFGRADEVCITGGSISDLKTFYNGEIICFTNTQTAQRDFGPVGSQGDATVTIKNLVLVLSGSETAHQAELVKVINKQ